MPSLFAIENLFLLSGSIMAILCLSSKKPLFSVLFLLGESVLIATYFALNTHASEIIMLITASILLIITLVVAGIYYFEISFFDTIRKPSKIMAIITLFLFYLFLVNIEKILTIIGTQKSFNMDLNIDVLSIIIFFFAILAVLFCSLFLFSQEDER